MALPPSSFARQGSTQATATARTATPTHAAPPAATPAVPASGASPFRRVKDEAASSYAKATIKPMDTGEVKVSGEFYGYVSSIDMDEMRLSITVAAPGQPENGVEVPLFMRAKADAKPFRKTQVAKETAKFFTDSGFPESTWEIAANGNRVPPVPGFFVESVDAGNGEILYFPVLLHCRFDLEVDKNDAGKTYQRIAFAKKTGCIAPLPGFVTRGMADSIGWKVTTGTAASGRAWCKVNTQAMAEVNDHFGKAHHGQSLFGDCEDIEV